MALAVAKASPRGTEPGAPKLSAMIAEDGEVLGDRALVGDQRGHAAMRVDREIFGGALLARHQVDALSCSAPAS
jgi:hypothetical protein